MKFYHASDVLHGPGTLLDGFKYGMGRRISLPDREALLENVRPKQMVSRLEAVFMSKHPCVIDDMFYDYLELKPTDMYFFEVQPIGEVSGPFDGNLMIEISHNLGTKKGIRLAKDYWKGETTYPPQLEFLTHRAYVIRQVDPPATEDCEAWHDQGRPGAAAREKKR